MITIKIGGVIFETEKNFSPILNIINSNKYHNIFLVISAFGKTSKILKSSIEQILNNNFNSAIQELENLKLFYLNLMQFNHINKTEYLNSINQLFNELSGLFKGINLTGECSNKIWSKILAYGEIISSKIIYFYLLENPNHLKKEQINWLLATQILSTSSDYIKATPNLQKSKLKFKKQPTNNNHKIIITQGFFGSNDQNEICTMGFESSNLSACIIGQISKSEHIIFISDVQGIRTRGPKYFKNHKLINNLDYHTAENLGKLGLKLLIPSMINFAKKYKLNIQFHSYKNYNDNYSLISKNPTSKTSEIIIPDKDNNTITLYNLNINTLNTITNSNYFKKNLEKIIFESNYLILNLISHSKFKKSCQELELLL